MSDASVMQDDLAALLGALGMGDHARPQPPHEVMLEAIAAVRRLRAERDGLKALLSRGDDHRPTWLPETLYLVTVEGEWPINVATSEQQAIQTALQRRGSLARRVRITRIAVGGCEALELQEQVIRRALVPEGTASTS